MWGAVEPTPLKLPLFNTKKKFGCVLKAFPDNGKWQKNNPTSISWQNPVILETRNEFDFFETEFENEKL